MEISKLTTVAELITLAADVPELLKMTLGGLDLMIRTKEAVRNEGINENMTLTDFYKQWYVPRISARKKQNSDTINQRETALKYWATFTGDPPLANINDATIDKFLDGLYQIDKKGGGKISDQTVRKHLSAVSSVMVYAGPRNNQYKRATGLMAELPEFPTIAKRADVNGRTPTFEQFEKIIKACKVATRPILPDITPKEWFECAYLFLYATGVRYEDFIDARWNRIRRMQDVNVLVIPPEREKTHRERIVPLSELAESVLQKMPRCGSDEKIFRWGASNAANTEKAVQQAIEKQRKNIAKAAGLDPVLCTFHAIRRLTATMLDPAVAANVLGNNPLTCRQHYQTVAVAARAVAALPLPNISDI